MIPALPPKAALAPPVHVDALAVQVVMWNPTVFPANPEQFTQGLQVTLWSNGRVTGRPFGTKDGMEIDLEVQAGPGGQRRVRFPFTIEGLP